MISIENPDSVLAEKISSLVVQKLQQREPCEYVSVKGASEILGLSTTKVIRKAIKTGDLPCINLSGKQRSTIRISRKDLDDWIQSKKIIFGSSRSERQALVAKWFSKQRAV